MLGVMPDDRFGKRVLFSRPYYLARCQHVQRDGDSLDPIPDEVAIEDGALVRGLPDKAMQRPLPSTEAVLQAVVAGKIKSGYVISTRGQWLAAQKWPGKLKFLDGAEIDCFPICAAVRKSDADLKEAIDQVFAELTESGELSRVFARWHVPYGKP
jgi:ABC-type amino acid transport substrate-binding protein